MNRLLQLADIINSRLVTIVHQPIIDLETGETIGYEALARGPAGYFEMPTRLFRHAADYDVLLDLDQLCLDMALSNLQSGLNFVNVVPQNVSKIRLPQKEFRDRLVIEITEMALDGVLGEASAVFDRWKDQGIKLAVDDVGKGSLASVMQVRPDFVKIDRLLVGGCYRDLTSRVILKYLASIAEDIGTQAIAEGIERPEELETIRSTGIRYGQGYLLGRPERRFPKGDDYIAGIG